MRLEGKVALITGGGTGIGRAIAEAFVAQGARVCVAGRRQQPLDEVVSHLPSDRAISVTADVTHASEVRHAVEATVARFGALNILVNNAGVLIAGTADTHTEEEFDRTLATNVKGVWFCVQAALPHLRRAGGGSIINLSSVVGLTGIANRVAYGASKGAVTIMTRCMASDLGREQIRVNCICPGIVETEMVADFIRKAPDPEAARKSRLGLHPIGRFGQPSDIASCAVYLASDESSWVTGAAFPIDGGYTAAKA